MPLNNGAINEIVQFGHGAGANVMAQGEYVADMARTAGNQSGLARSKFVNKIWRQSTHLAAGVAQWIANRYAPGVRDNGDLDAIEAGMTAAVQSLAAASWPLMVVTWDAWATYQRKTLVIGSNGKLYLWLAPSGPGVAGVGAKDPVAGGNAGYWLDYAASIAPPVQKVEKYDLCEFYAFRHPTLKPGFQPAHGGVIANANALYTKAWTYLATSEGQKLCVTEAQWQSMVNAVWHINADGSRVGWNGIGGAPFFAPDWNTGALRLPDLRGMYAEAAGFDALGVGGVHGDAGRLVTGNAGYFNDDRGVTSAGALQMVRSGEGGYQQSAGARWLITLNSSHVVPVAAKNQPRAWGSLACVCLDPSAS